MRGIINHWQEVAYSHPHEMREQDGWRKREIAVLFNRSRKLDMYSSAVGNISRSPHRIKPNYQVWFTARQTG